MSLSNIDWNAGESWTVARRYADMLKPIPPSVSDAIRTLWRNSLQNREESEPQIQQKSFDVVARVDNTTLIKTPLYFAALDFYEDKFEAIQEDDTSRALLRILGVDMFAYLLGLIYLHRRLNKLNTSELWEDVSKEFVLNMQLGFLIGEEIAGIGGPTGLLIGGIRYAALGTLLKHSPEEYQKHTNVTHGLLNRSEEHGRWGCDHSQIAALLLRSLGIDLDPLQCANALRPEIPLSDSIPTDLVPWRATTVLIELAAAKKSPTKDELNEAGIEVEGSALSQLFSSLEAYVDGGTTFNWMFRSTKSE